MSELALVTQRLCHSRFRPAPYSLIVAGAGQPVTAGGGNAANDAATAIPPLMLDCAAVLLVNVPRRQPDTAGGEARRIHAKQPFPLSYVCLNCPPRSEVPRGQPVRAGGGNAATDRYNNIPASNL